MTAAAPPFDLLQPGPPASPLLLSVPHGGRTYPDEMLEALRVAPSRLVALEDRHVDSLARAAWRGEWAILARNARAWIDLNRAEDERDPLVEPRGAIAPPVLTAKVRSGLGLIPRRVPRIGDIWRRRLSGEEVTARIACDHRPYHDSIGRALAEARARFGTAMLVDIHSMPPLPANGPRVVIGDRFGRTAAGRFAARAEAVANAAGIATAINTPYAGGHVLDRHHRASAGVHALQIEIDRSLYLDGALDRPGAGFVKTARLLRAMLDALTDEVLAGALPSAIAAE